jgi:hypothetical protein
VRLSSNPDDFDPEKIMHGLVVNRTFRNKFKPEMLSPSQMRNYQQVINRHTSKDQRVNVLKEFGEGKTGVIVERERDYQRAKVAKNKIHDVLVGGIPLS